MVYLFLACICSASIAIIFKHIEGKNCNRFEVTSFNYMTAAVISLIMIINSGQPFFMKVADPVKNLMNNFSGNITLQGSYVWAILLGVITGILYLCGFLLYQISIEKSGASLSAMFNKMGIVVPMIFSMIIWREIPGVLQWIGIVMSMFAIIIVNLNFGGKERSSVKPQLMIMFIIVGFSEFTNKLFQKYAMTELKNHFMFTLFFTALITSFILLFRNRKQGLNFKSAIYGVMVGIPNMLSTFFLIEALNRIPATIVYPVFSASSIVIIMIVTTLIFKERLKKKEVVAMIITILALVFINL